LRWSGPGLAFCPPPFYEKHKSWPKQEAESIFNDVPVLEPEADSILLKKSVTLGKKTYHSAFTTHISVYLHGRDYSQYIFFILTSSVFKEPANVIQITALVSLC
jgi:hypothetical protein